jgi:[ribosomal protein S5]-alanine N-acetyltransferase
MTGVVFRKGERIVLRPIERGDAPAIRRWMNDPAITQWLSHSLPMSEADAGDWIEQVSRAKTVFAFGILVEGSALVGFNTIHSVNWQHRTAMTGTIIGEREYWGRGYATEARKLLLDYAFNSLDLFALQARVAAHNVRSVSYAKGCGYEEVGRIPNWYRRDNGERSDEVLLLVTQESWRRVNHRDGQGSETPGP